MRTARGSTVVVIVGTLAACAPSTTHVKVSESLGPPRAVTDPPSERVLTASAAASEAGLTIGVEETQRCHRYDVRTAKRREVRDKDVNDFVVVLEYLFALGIGGAGGAALYDPDYVSENLEPTFTVTPDDAVTGGYVAAGVGGALFGLAIIDTIRGGTSTRDLPDEDRKAMPTVVDCGRGPAVGVALTLEVGAERAPLGSTGKDGALAITWEQVGEGTIAAAVTAGRGKVRVGAADGPTADIDSAVAAKVAARRALGKAIAAGTLEALQAATNDPVVAAADPALLAAAADPLYDAAVSARITAGDADAARGLVDDWARRVPSSPRLVAQRQALADFERKGLPGVRWEEFELALAKAKETGEPEAFARARQALSAFEAVSAGDTSSIDGAKRLAKARNEADKVRLARAMKQAERARELARKGDFAGADEALTAADQLAPGHKTVVAARQRVDARRKEAEDRAAREEAKRAAADEKAAAAEAKRAEAAEAAEAKRAQAAEAAETKRMAIEAAAAAKRQAAEDAAAARRQGAEDAASAKRQAAEDAAARKTADADEPTTAGDKAAEEKAAVAAARKAAADAKAAARAEAKARRDAERAAAAEAKRVAAVEKAAARDAEKARRAAAEKAADDARRGGKRGTTTRADDLVGLWATPVDGGMWLVELRAGGAARTALWQRGALVASTPAQWTAAGDALTLDVARQRVAAPASRAGRALTWLGVRWSRL